MAGQEQPLTSTPILDRQQPAPPQKGRSRASILIGAVLGVAIVRWAPQWVPEIESPASLLVSLIAGYYVVVLIHELGHLAAATVQGFEFREIAAGPFVLRRQTSGLRARFVPGRILAGGHVTGVPDSHRDLRRRFKIVLSGGPIATALLFVCLAFLPLTQLTWVLWIWNAVVAASSWLPFYTRGSVTDAKAVLILSRPGSDGEWLAAVLYLIVLDRQGVSPRDWPAEVVAQLASNGDSPPAALARYFTLVCALDLGERERVAEALERLLESSNHLRPDLRRTCFSEAAFYQGVMARNAELALAWLKDARKVTGTTADKGWDAGLLAAVAFAEGKEEEAREHARGAIAYLGRWPATSGSVAAAKRRLGAL
jgi:hypothetical protein